MAELYPIWRDYFVDLGSVEATTFHIFADDTCIYTGISHRRPDQESNKIRINDICADYLVNTFPSLIESGMTRNISVPTFRVSTPNPIEYESDITVAEVMFAADWSYDPTHNVAVASSPIDGVIDPRQPIIYSAYNTETVEAVLGFEDGSTLAIQFPLAVVADFDGDFNGDFAISVISAAAGSVVIDPENWSGLNRVTIGATTYRIEHTCARYAIYYANAYGGWDSFIPRNISTREDGYKRYDHSRQYDNSQQSNRERVNYLTEVSPSWSLLTHYMTDAESLKMHHLIGSTDVYLYDMEGGDMLPVVVADKSVSYLTAKNNGRKFPAYTVTLELAQTRIRR